MQIGYYSQGSVQFFLFKAPKKDQYNLHCYQNGRKFDRLNFKTINEAWERSDYMLRIRGV